MTSHFIDGVRYYAASTIDPLLDKYEKRLQLVLAANKDLREVITQLFTDADGNMSFHGSDGDRALLKEALEAYDAAVALKV